MAALRPLKSCKKTNYYAMKGILETYKGIGFVRISSLPEDQKKLIWSSFNAQKIIKILRENELLNDCLLYEDYQDWYNRYKETGISESDELPKELKLVLK